MPTKWDPGLAPPLHASHAVLGPRVPRDTWVAINIGSQAMLPCCLYSVFN